MIYEAINKAPIEYKNMRDFTSFLKNLDLINSKETTVKTRQIAVPTISISESLLIT